MLNIDVKLIIFKVFAHEILPVALFEAGGALFMKNSKIYLRKISSVLSFVFFKQQM